ncbi:FecR family protein [Pedobacter frigoris]|uniref:DUF4974 domain-containing protein n=1 Tax=Pedobacter frigoris TaxID=2571272 RepID=A0A4U1CHS4_9SPHI|nr:FecR family protein [Pedobacter frigoris]TKC05981.1 DUF4974 domain-containing protein [Pedobacter frigoris]
MNKQAFLEIIERVTDGTASDEQLKLYNQYIDELKGDGSWDKVRMGDEAETRQALLALIDQKIDRPAKKQDYKLWYRAVAAVVVLSVSVWLYLFLNESKISAIPQDITAENDIAPGGNRAVLTLANGKVFDLETADIGELASDAGLKIFKVEDGVIEYKTVSSAVGVLGGIHTLTTPKGGTYRVILSDGTKVSLNPLSTLKYLSKFDYNSKRSVELNGEAYFAVTKSKAEFPKDQHKIFSVLTDKQEVEVLGTHFNIQSYSNEAATRTTLIEGVVRVSRLASTGSVKSLVLKPGEESVLTDKTFEVVEGNVEAIEAWQNGRFLFDNEHITSIMRKIARWYDVDAIYPEKMPRDLNFSGSISKNKNLSQILRIMELTRSVHFKINGRTLYIMSDE